MHYADTDNELSKMLRIIDNSHSYTTGLVKLISNIKTTKERNKTKSQCSSSSVHSECLTLSLTEELRKLC